MNFQPILDKAIFHPILGWALAQAYTSQGLGADSGKLKAYRERLKFDHHFTIEHGKNGTRIYYSQLGILALAKLINTPQSADFAAVVLRVNAHASIVPVATTPAPLVVEPPVWQGEITYPYQPKHPELTYELMAEAFNTEQYPEFWEVEPIQPTSIAAPLHTPRGAMPVSTVAQSQPVHYTVSKVDTHHNYYELPKVPWTDTFRASSWFYLGSIILIFCCFCVPIAAVALLVGHQQQPSTNNIYVR